MRIAKNKRRVILREHARSEIIGVGEGATLTYIFFAGQKNQTIILNINLEGRGSTVKVFGFNIADRSAMRVNIAVCHKAPQTSGFTRIKSVLGGVAQSTISGMIRMEKVARLAEGYFTHNTLLLSQGVLGKTSPSLEIEANEVKASHAATIGHFDAEVLFYLMSRGIKAAVAKKLVMLSFVSEYLQEIDEESTRTECRHLLERRLASL